MLTRWRAARLTRAFRRRVAAARRATPALLRIRLRAGRPARGDPGRATRIARRRLGAAVLASVVLTVAALVTAGQLRPPARVAVRTEPPPRSVLTAPVRKRVLTATVALTGRVGAEQTVNVVPRPDPGGPPIVTAVPLRAGDRVDRGHVLMELSGRPVFALPGDIPAYRDLRPGATGRDVAQLQAALKSVGFDSHDRRGSYGAGTKDAVRRFYRAKGYEPQPASDEDDGLVSRAQRAVTAAERALRDARDALRRARGAGLAAARLAVSDRTEDLSQARNERDAVERRTGPLVPAREVVFLRGFPGRVDAVAATVGAQAKDTLLTVSAGRLVVTGDLTAHQKGLVHPGLRVQVRAEGSDRTADATVRSVADTPHGPEAEADPRATGYAMVAVPRGALDVRLAGQDVRLTVIAASTDDPVLVVPVAAVSGGADGRTSVTVVTRGERRRVEVTTGLVGDGYVQVTPVGGGELGPDDQVLVGS